MQVGFGAKVTNRREKESKKSNFYGCMNLIYAQGKGGFPEVILFTEYTGKHAL